MLVDDGVRMRVLHVLTFEQTCAQLVCILVKSLKSYAHAVLLYSRQPLCACNLPFAVSIISRSLYLDVLKFNLMLPFQKGTFT